MLDKAWLEAAQSSGNLAYLEQILSDCQRRFDAKMQQRGASRLADDLHRAKLDAT